MNVLLLLFLLHMHVAGKAHNIEIFASQEIARLDHFWESTGLCPPLPHSDASKFFLSDDMVQNLLLISSVPHNGIKQVRIHWLLELIRKEYSSYDFSNLDKLMEMLFAIDLKPGFEIMGNPSDIFTNFDNMAQVFELKKLVTLIAERYIKKFGIKYVSSWNFETWNEPDHKDFDNVTMTVDGFLKYYDACSEGLKDASSSLVFGGPGGSCRNAKFSKRCWALFGHIINGTNYVTGKIGSRLDYISFHKKGQGKAEVIIDTELETISQIHTNYPALKSTPIFNDEADPLVGWSKPQWWRADATYAAVIAKVISQHQNNMTANKSRQSINYSLLSNDNAFLSYSPHYFTQRTLNARFQINNTSPNYVHFVKKPSLIVMGLFAKLGNIQLNKTGVSDKIGGIATLCNPDVCPYLEIASLIYNSADTEQVTDTTSIELKYHDLANITDGFHEWRNQVPHGVKAVTCSVNNFYTNPNQLWREFGSPDFPTAHQFKRLHAFEGPHCTEPEDVTLNAQGHYVRKIGLPLPGVILHHICWKPLEPPQKPTQLQGHNITVGQVLLTWKDALFKTKCIKSFIVQFAPSKLPHLYQTINKYKIIFNSFIHITSHNHNGFYRVQAVDYWNRASDFSEVLHYAI